MTMPRAERLTDAVTLYEGRCEDVLPVMHEDDFDSVVTDPPYGEGFSFEGDHDPELATEVFSRFLSSFSFRPGTYMAAFWTAKSLDNLLDCARQKGWTYLRILGMNANGTARPHLGFLPRLQPIGLFRIGIRASELHDRFSVAIKAAIRMSGLTHAHLAKKLGCDSRLIQKWSRYRDPAWCLPTTRFYGPLKKLIGLSDEFDGEMQSRSVAEVFTPLSYSQDTYTVRSGSSKTSHPCEKPIGAMRWLIRGMPGDTILDPFAGSGTTAIAAMMEGRKCILIEQDPRYCDIIRRRVREADGRAPNTLFASTVPAPDLFANVRDET